MYSWTGFITQAGISLGFAGIIAAEIPIIGEGIRTVIIGMILINQIVGPILFKWGLEKGGQIKEST